MKLHKKRVFVAHLVLYKITQEMQTKQNMKQHFIILRKAVLRIKKKLIFDLSKETLFNKKIKKDTLVMR